MCHQIASALLECHQRQIAHQDIKPANVLLDQYGRPKLADFGLSQQFDGQAKTQQRVGSLAYMAPEVLSGGHRDAFRSDVWSLGITFYYMAVGRLPWNAETSFELETIIKSGVYPNPTNCVPSFRAVLRKMLTPEPAQRPPLEWVVAQLGAIVQETQPEKGAEPFRGHRSGSMPLMARGSWANGLLLAPGARRISTGMKSRIETFQE